MANILICGFKPQGAETVRNRIDKIMIDAGLGDAITSIVPMDTRTCDGRMMQSPHLCIRSNSDIELNQVVNALKSARIEEDVEVERLTDFIPAGKMK